jgi:hypothetical protein
MDHRLENKRALVTLEAAVVLERPSSSAGQ